MPTYDGPVDGNEKFDPSRLSAVTAQVKFKVAGDKKAELAIRPMGVPRDRRQPLPYLALLMELGSESKYRESNSKIRCTASEPLPDGKFGEYCDALDAAEKKLASHPKGKDTKNNSILDNLKKETNDARTAIASCNRYSISVRGASQDVYGILDAANIADEFATLLSIIMPLPANEHSTRQHMRPLERLSNESSHTDWMSEYVV